jgi:ABC-type branched-subunit amino acid transport system substrate-binding protein
MSAEPTRPETAERIESGEAAAKPAPVCIGILHDRPAADGGAGFERIVRIGVDEVAAARQLDRPLEFIHASGLGLPMGTARAVEDAFSSLVERGALAIIGPAISDNGLVARDLADAARIPCINYTGGEQTRSEWMFHYQVGSLEDEPTVLARHLAAQGLKTAAVVHDRSPIGHRYAAYFDEACASLGIDLVGSATISPLAQDLSAVAAKLQAARPEALVYLGLGLSAFPLGQALQASGWDVPVVANSALMFGYAYPDWTQVWEGWIYADGVADDNRLLERLRGKLGADAPPGPGAAAAYDLGRLMAEAVGRAVHLTREGLRDGLERVKLLPATIGREGTTMGFGRWERSALKGEFLVLRQWRSGRTRELEG